MRVELQDAKEQIEQLIGVTGTGHWGYLSLCTILYAISDTVLYSTVYE